MKAAVAVLFAVGVLTGTCAQGQQLSAKAKAALEESFTIFLDLDDYHVTKDGSHEFLTQEHVGEHDNVILHMSEAEMRLHMDRHETHDCEHPSQQHEIVSFIQEAMYERPAEPNFIDDAINANYIQNSGQWENQPMPQMQMPQMQMPQMQMPQMQMPQMPQMPQMNQFPNLMKGKKEKNDAKAPAIPKAQSKPKAEKSKPAAVKAQPKPEPEPLIVAASPGTESINVLQAPVIDADEEAAVARFRDAYHAHKYEADHHSAAETPSAEQKASAADASSVFDNLFDDEDKKAMGLFTGDRKSLPTDAFSAEDFGIDNVLDKIVDEALGRQTELAPKTEEHHHHNHHKKEEKLAVKEEAKSDDSEDLTPAEKKALKSLLKKMAAEPPHQEQPLSTVDPEVAEEKKVEEKVEEKKVEEKKVEEKEVEMKEKPKLKKVSDKEELVASDVSEKTAKAQVTLQRSIIEEEEEQALGAKPIIPSTEAKSYISKAPSASDFIPESVYAQQDVSFNEAPTVVPKHLPKRILIPRMEEPGPVIGGGSRPVHIMLPPSEDMQGSPKGNTRPAPPVQAQIAAAFGPSVPSSITNAVEQQAASNKVTTLAAANDEALTAAEVIIF